MKSITFLLFLSIAVICQATEKLTSETYNAFLKSGKNGMVKFYQDWCGHCKRMKPDWDSLAFEHTTLQSPILIADVDCGAQEDLCSEVGVTGYPTIKYYADGKIEDYNGGRSLDDLLQFVAETILPHCTFNNEAKSCSEKSLKYIEKWSKKSAADTKKEMDRLENLIFEEMKPHLKTWVRERFGILKSKPEEKEL